jgi:hypothetical protein
MIIDPMQVTLTDQVSPRRRGDRAIAAVMTFSAATLAIFSTMHLFGVLYAGAGSGASKGAGIAEAVICLALLVGVRAFVREPARGSASALLSIAFAILGFIVGLTFTLHGSDAIDLAYHLALLPVLIITAVLLSRRRVD